MAKDDLPLRKIDHLRFFVGNARQSAYFYRNAFGFEQPALLGVTSRRPEADLALRIDDAVPGNGVVTERRERIAHAARMTGNAREARDEPIRRDSAVRNTAHDSIDSLVGHICD